MPQPLPVLVHHRAGVSRVSYFVYCYDGIERFDAVVIGVDRGVRLVAPHVIGGGGPDEPPLLLVLSIPSP